VTTGNHEVGVTAQLAAIQQSLASVSVQLADLTKQVTPVLLAQSGLSERLARMRTDIDSAHSKHRDHEGWRLSFERQINDHLHRTTETLGAIQRFMADQLKANEAATAHRIEWDRWRYTLLGGVIVVQGIFGLALVFKAEISQALFGGG